MKIYIIILIMALIGWIAWSYFASNVEQLKYTVLEKKNNYEIRKYDKYIEASVTVDGKGEEALNSGFRILANYIFGGNLGKQQVAMTAPVLAQEKNLNKLGGDGEQVAMTAPVLAAEANGKTKIVFSMPSKYQISDLPKTADGRISFKEIGEMKIAAYTFGWYFGKDTIDTKKREFLKILNNDKQKIIGEPIYAGYNAPWTIPLMIRNEILVEIE